jgi:ABC-type phosphate transport system permease subunit
MPFTMAVSAFWHGIHAGYFLSFLTIPVCTAVEDELFRLVPEHTKPRWLRIRLMVDLWDFLRKTK